MGRNHGRVGRAQFGACRVQCGARRKAGKDFGHAMFTPRDHGGGKMMRAGYDVGDDFSGNGVGN